MTNLKVVLAILGALLLGGCSEFYLRDITPSDYPGTLTKLPTDCSAMFEVTGTGNIQRDRLDLKMRAYLNKANKEFPVFKSYTFDRLAAKTSDFRVVVSYARLANPWEMATGLFTIFTLGAVPSFFDSTYLVGYDVVDTASQKQVADLLLRDRVRLVWGIWVLPFGKSGLTAKGEEDLLENMSGELMRRMAPAAASACEQKRRKIGVPTAQ